MSVPHKHTASRARKWATSTVHRSFEGGTAVFTKVYQEGSGPDMKCDVIRRRTSREMDLIGRINECGRFRGSLGTLKLVNGDPSAGRLVTAEVAGQPLTEWLRNSHDSIRDNDLLKAFRLAGEWIRVFQELEIESEDAVEFTQGDPSDVPSYCQIRLARMRALGSDWPSPRIERQIMAHLERLERETSAEDRGQVWCHCDYGPQNILWDGTTLTPLDFAMARLDRPLVDVTHLIHRLEMLKIYFPWRRWPIAKWREAILSGYGRPEVESSPMYDAMMIRHLHCRLMTYTRRKPPSLKERTHNAYVRCRLRRELIRRTEGRQIGEPST